jgi:hydroxymethylpyrimidine pyrophosphatase-like HAD family hydrolase
VVRYRVLAFDYDGTLAKDGRVADSTVAALERAGRSGRQLLLVTGRELDDLQRVFPRLDLFDRVVAENGGLLYRPDSRRREPLGGSPPAEFVARLREQDVTPLGVGEVMVATREPHDKTVLDAIRELGLELQVIFNKGAVMVLPAGVNKATGLATALAELGMSPHNVLGVGDAENDHAFLDACECSVAVANALPALKESCDVVTAGSRGAGVEEIIGRVVDSDLADLDGGPGRQHVVLGHRHDEEVRLPPYGSRMIVAGPSGSGKSTVTSAVRERLSAAGYQVCLIDSEGDYDDGIGGTSVVVGDAGTVPSVREIVGLLEQPGQSVVVNLLAVPIPDRPGFFAELLPQIAALATRYSRPHWLVVDEAHHLVPSAMDTRAVGLLGQVGSIMLITVHPEAVDPAVLGTLNTVLAVGGDPAGTIQEVARRNDARPPPADELDLGADQLALWRSADGRVEVVDLAPPEAEHRRHRRKYAVGTMSSDTSFYFRGPDERLNLRAHNLALFVQIGDGVDDETWLHHLRQGDYSRWLRDTVDDADLAAAIADVEQDEALPTEQTRERIRQLILDRYTQAAEPNPEGSTPA